MEDTPWTAAHPNVPARLWTRVQGPIRGTVTRPSPATDHAVEGEDLCPPLRLRGLVQARPEPLRMAGLTERLLIAGEQAGQIQLLLGLVVVDHLEQSLAAVTPPGHLRVVCEDWHPAPNAALSLSGLLPTV